MKILTELTEKQKSAVHKMVDGFMEQTKNLPSVEKWMAQGQQSLADFYEKTMRDSILKRQPVILEYAIKVMRSRVESI